jgi:hypothetical protein
MSTIGKERHLETIQILGLDNAFPESPCPVTYTISDGHVCPSPAELIMSEIK